MKEIFSNLAYLVGIILCLIALFTMFETIVENIVYRIKKIKNNKSKDENEEE